MINNYGNYILFIYLYNIYRHDNGMSIGCGERTAGILDRVQQRGQSEVIGALLLTAVVIIVLTTAGFFLFGEVTGDDEQPLADINYDVSSDRITLSHTSGDTLDADDITVRVTGDFDEELALSDDFETDGDNDFFSPGDTWRTGNGVFSGADGDEGDLLVIHEPSNTVLLDESFVIGEDGGGGGDGGAPTPASFADGSTTAQAGGNNNVKEVTFEFAVLNPDEQDYSLEFDIGGDSRSISGNPTVSAVITEDHVTTLPHKFNQDGPLDVTLVLIEDGEEREECTGTLEDGSVVDLDCN